MARLAPGPSTDDIAGAAFIDVETTGLTGGTGTYVFLVGLGAFEDGSFRLRQFFLAALPRDPATLAGRAGAWNARTTGRGGRSPGSTSTTFAGARQAL